MIYFFGNCIENLTWTQRHCALDCACCALTFIVYLLGFFSKLTNLSTAFRSPRRSRADLELSAVSSVPLEMIKGASSVRAGSICTPPGTSVCVLRSICYQKVNEVNHQGVDAGFSATAHDRRAIFLRGLAPCTMCEGVLGHRRATRARARPFW